MKGIKAMLIRSGLYMEGVKAMLIRSGLYMKGIKVMYIRSGLVFLTGYIRRESRRCSYGGGYT